MLGTILKIAGLICWLLAAFGVPVTRINLIAAGAFLFFLPDVL